MEKTVQKTVGNILSLFISKAGDKQRYRQHTLQLDPKGIIQDKYYNKNIERSILITSIESYRLVEQYHIQMSYGTLGENLLIDYNPYQLVPGQQLQIGTTILQISQNCTICEHLSTVDPQLPKLLEKDRGIFAKVVQSGVIQEGDTIQLLKVPHAM